MCVDICMYMYVYVCIYIYYLSIYVYVSACSSSLLTSRTAVTCRMMYTQQYLFTFVINKLHSIQGDTNVSQLVLRVIPGSYEPLTSLGELSSSSLNRLYVCLSCLFWLCVPPVVYGRHVLCLHCLRVGLISEGIFFSKKWTPAIKKIKKQFSSALTSAWRQLSYVSSTPPDNWRQSLTTKSFITVSVALLNHLIRVL